MARLYFRELRLRRIRHGIEKQEMAKKLECSLGWLSQLELYDYKGPSRDVWAERYQQALNEMIAERRASSDAAKTG